MYIKTLSLLAAAGTVLAQGRPSNTSICDYYTTALLKENNSTNQYTLLTLVVNTVGIGNYTQPNVGISVPGILAQNQSYMGTPVNLLPYFSGALASTNRGGSSGVSVNFLDGGGAQPLMMNMPASDTTSNQYKLITHLYQYFGVLLGCTQYGTTGFPGYGGSGSQYEVHKYMALTNAEVGYFIQQVGLAAASFGVAQSDVEIVGNSLNKLFGYRCAPATTVVPSQGSQLQSICIAPDCPVSPNSTCASNYTAPVIPSPVSSGATSSATGMTNGTGAGTGGSAPTASPKPFTGAASYVAISGGVVVAMIAGAMAIIA